MGAAGKTLMLTTPLGASRDRDTGLALRRSSEDDTTTQGLCRLHEASPTQAKRLSSRVARSQQAANHVMNASGDECIGRR